MYSDIPGGNPAYNYYYNSGDECGSYNEEGDCFNREHSWPSSWFDGNMPMYSDLFHLYPTDGFVNNKRSNYPFGEVGQTDWVSDNGSKLGNCSWPGYSGTVFEPVDGYKGDFARTYFYMSVRYYTEDSGWPGSPMAEGSQLKDWAIAMLMQWNAQDPVSQKETDRNNHVYTIQDNRNPFIDHPEYAKDIWGNGSGILTGNGPERISVYPNPAVGMCFVNLPLRDLEDDFEIRVADPAGRSFNCSSEKEANRIRLETGSLPAGIYFVMINGFSSGKSYCGLLIRN
jgi:endonuclease I